MRYLPDVAGHRRFVNADLIAAGLSPLAPQVELVRASRLLLQAIEAHIRRREDFAFETTLAGRGYLRLIKRLRINGWNVVLIYLALMDDTLSAQRVAERVRYGGHDIPAADIRRRFPRSLANLFDHYLALCDYAVCHDNANAEPILVFEKVADTLIVHDQYRFDLLHNKARK